MLFNREHYRGSTAERRRRYAIYEIVYTIVDFSAAFTFIIGSVLFALKPTIRLIRELRLAAIGDEDDLADKFKE